MISTQGLCTAFGSHTVLRDVSLSIRGGIYALLGPNGAGKTTLIRTLLGLVPAQRGRCTVAGMDVATHATAVRARCGALLESTGLYPGYSIARNLDYHGNLYGLHGRELRQRISAVSEQFGLVARMQQPCGELSRGWRKKVALARAMIHKPSILFLDEPSNGLDPASADELCQLLRNLREDSGVTILLTTHLLSEAETLCDAVGVLVQGRLTFSGEREQLLHRQEATLIIHCESPTEEHRVKDVASTTGFSLSCQKDGSVLCKLGPDQRPSDALSALLTAGLDVTEVQTQRSSLLEAYRSQLGETTT